MIAKITVFTATYNRCGFLKALYLSLAEQTCLDFEWLVVDDGSTDGTTEIINSFTSAAPFPILYIKTENRGKHFALNLIPTLSSAPLFLVVDSDHRLFPRAVERLLYYYQAIKSDSLDNYTGVSCLAVDQNFSLIGEPFLSADASDEYANKILRHTRLRNFHYESRLGDKLELVKVSILLEYPFPIVETKCLPESYFVHRYSVKYKTLCFNEIHAQFSLDTDSASLSKAIGSPDNAFGDLYYYIAWLQYSYRLFFRNPIFFLVIAKGYLTTAKRAKLDSKSALSRIKGALPRLILYGGSVILLVGGVWFKLRETFCRIGRILTWMLMIISSVFISKHK
jgi:glycosyltransferase involved in cell wall biosynthesis